MTTAAAGSDRAAPLALLHRHWRLLAVIALGLGPFVPSILAMSDFALSDNAVGFTPVAIPAAAYLFWLRSHHDGEASARDVFTDVFLMAPLLAAAFFILFVTPSSLSWYFWLYRMDLAALAPWATVVALAFLGYQQVIRTWPAWLMLVFAWPYPVMRVQALLTDPFVDVTAATGRAMVDFLRLPYEMNPLSPAAFTSTHLAEGENFTLIVGQLCSGTAATLGFLTVGLALALMSRGAPERRLLWLAAGLGLAFLSNLLRVVVLLTVATSVSRGAAVDVVHPILGLVLFALVVLLMLLALPLFGLRFDPAPRGRRLAWAPGRGRGRAPVALWALVAVASLGIGLGVAQAQRFDFLGTGEGAPTISVASERTIIPQMAPWTLTHETEISWTDLFGRTSRGDAFSYHEPDWPDGGAVIGVQTIVTDDKSTLERYTLEQCIDFHRRDLEARRAVDLGYGVTGYILHHTYQDIPAAMLYWVFPVNVEGEIRHARIALYGDAAEPTTLPGAEAATAGHSPLTSRMGQALENAMDGLPALDDGVRDDIDRGLVAMAVRLLDTMVTTGGPAAPDAAAAAR
ncbi:MAG: archaeosortase/exosortase family protein [Dehalococcoidia bacterium]